MIASQGKEWLMKIKRVALFIIASLLLTLLISPLRGFGYGIKASSLVGFTVYFVFTLWGIRKSADTLLPSQITLAIVAGLFLLQLPLRIRGFTSSLFSFPDFVLHFLGIVFGFAFARLHSPQKWLTTVLGFSLALFMFFTGYDLWLHRLNFGTFTGKVSYTLPAKFEAFDQSKNLVTDKDFANKVILLDFWNTSCGVCFQKFPQLQKFYEKHKEDAAISILAVDAPLEDDKEGDAFQAIKEEKYTFPVVITKDANLPELFGITGYPTTFVIDQKGNVVFKGSIEGATKQVEELLKVRQSS